MDCFHVRSRGALNGRVTAAGSKNAALPFLAASLLLEGQAQFDRVPGVRDVETLLELLQFLGVERLGHEGERVVLGCGGDGPTEAPYEVVRRMRASVCVLGPLLARRGRARVSLPGGCVLGVRPIDLHLKGLTALGARIRVEHGTVVAETGPEGLRGARIYLASRQGSTVLGTANVMMAACLATGQTVIEAAACEPEIAALADYLNACGARISGVGSSRLVIEGVDALQARPVSVPADRIETGTLLIAGAMTAGQVRVEDCRPQDHAALLDLFDRSGVGWAQGETDGRPWLEVQPWRERPRVLDIATRPFPGFPTDLQAQWMAFCTVGEGLAVVTDTIYPDRFMHVAELNRLGASIRREGAMALVLGPTRLSGAPVLASDLRASAALVLAGLVAEGCTTVRRVYHLDRGYEGFERKLLALGADVERAPDPESP